MSGIPGKLWAARVFAQFKDKRALLSAVKSDLNVRQVHMQAVDKYIAARLGKNTAGGGRVTDDDWIKTLVTVTHQVKQSIKLRLPDRDLIPEAALQKLYLLKFSQCTIPVAVFRRADGSVVTGVLVHAESFNPMPGCYRVTAEEEFSILRSEELSLSDQGSFRQRDGLRASSSWLVTTMSRRLRRMRRSPRRGRRSI